MASGDDATAAQPMSSAKTLPAAQAWLRSSLTPSSNDGSGLVARVSALALIDRPLSSDQAEEVQSGELSDG